MSHAVGAAWRGFILVVVAVVVTTVALLGLEDHAVAYDLVQVYVPAGERVLEGASPFPTLDDPVLEQNAAYVYPPLTALLAVPLTALPDARLAILGVIGSLAALFGALWLLGVRDPRCYAVFALWPPTILAWQNANLSVLVVLACALAWRFRESWPRSGAALGLGVALKLVLWPLVFWFLATRRVWAAAVAGCVTAATVLLSWAVIGFDGLSSYPALLARLTELETKDTPGVSIFSAAIELGASTALAHLAALATGGSLLAASVVLARKRDDRAAFTLALLAVPAFTPIVWLHYLTLLALPLAIYRPRLSASWGIPLLFWVFALPWWPFELRRVVAVLVVALVVCLVRRPGRLLSWVAMFGGRAVPRSLPEQS
ncbi:MAG: glycosyltransferase family 87 protein [Gaiellaceae bacterium]